MGGPPPCGQKLTYNSVLTFLRIQIILEVRPPKPPLPRILGSVDGCTLTCPEEAPEIVKMAV